MFYASIVVAALFGQADAEPADPWKDASYKAIRDDFTVALLSARCAPVLLNDLGRAKFSKDPLLILYVGVRNRNRSKKMDYRGWSTKDFDGDKTLLARLTDDLENEYKRIDFGFFADVEGQLKQGESIYPDAGILDLLVFELPAKQSHELRLMLPGEAIGLKGPIHLKVPIGPLDGEGQVFDVRAVLRREAEAEAILKKARNRIAAGDKAAIVDPLLKSIVKKYPDTEAAVEAQLLLRRNIFDVPENAATDADKAKLKDEIAKKAVDQNESRAAAKMKSANDLLAAGKKDAYRRSLKEIVERYPETTAGKKAAKLLK